MQTPPPAPSAPRNSGLAIASLVLGLLSFFCCSILTGIPAIICGHLARSKAKKSPLVGGKEMALAGLILGYLSLAILPVLGIFSVPMLNQFAQQAPALVILGKEKRIATAFQRAHEEGVRTGNKKLGYPADTGMTNYVQLVEMFVTAEIFNAEQIKDLELGQLEFGNVSASDPDDTILVRSKARALDGFQAIILKDGRGNILKDGATPFGAPPPREPAFLE